MSDLKVSKPKMFALYLDEEFKKQIEIKAASLGLTANGYIKMLIKNDLMK
jgi:hypothetical protein